MSSILEMLAQKLDGSNVKEISRQIGASEEQTQSALGAALPTILAGLSRNAAQPQGAEALSRALSNDHDGSVLDNLGSLISNPDAGAGDGILRHVLGNRRGQVETGISRSSGLDQAATGKLLKMLAPAVMGALGKEQRRGNLDASSLTRLLGQEREAIERVLPKGMGLVGKLLDTDNDGDVDLSDLVKHGKGVLGKFLSR